MKAVIPREHSEEVADVDALADRLRSHIHATSRVDEDIERYGAQAPRRSASLQAAALAERRRRPEQLPPIASRPVGRGSVF